MNCIKCGREIRGEQFFCGECQEQMEFYPVKPGTPIQLPAQAAAPEARPKSSRSRKPASPELRLSRMRKTVRLLAFALAAALLAFVLMSCLTLYLLNQRDQQSRADRNCHTVTEE